jgi:cytoskeletal protein CcmA (bactofilin family)
MALFNKEPDKNLKPQLAAAPQTATIAPALAGAAAPGRSVLPAPSDGRAYLDRGSKISGKLNFEGAARIDGEVDGEIVGKDSITIGETAAVTAQIKAASVIVSGKVSGDIVATSRIEIRPSAKVNGNVTAPVLVIHEGAMFEGHCSMHPEARDERKVTVFPKEERLAQAAGGNTPA